MTLIIRFSLLCSKWIIFTLCGWFQVISLSVFIKGFWEIYERFSPLFLQPHFHSLHPLFFPSLYHASRSFILLFLISILLLLCPHSDWKAIFHCIKFVPPLVVRLGGLSFLRLGGLLLWLREPHHHDCGQSGPVPQDLPSQIRYVGISPNSLNQTFEFHVHSGPFVHF